MEIRVLIEPVAGNGYRAVGGDPFVIAVEGATREEVLDKVKAVIAEKLCGGAEVVNVEVPANGQQLIRWTAATQDPWLRMEGIYKDDPLFEEWQQAIEEYRQQVDPNTTFP